MIPRYFCWNGQSHIPPRCPSRDLGLTPARSRLPVGLDHGERRNPCPGNAVPRPWGSSRPSSHCSACARSHSRSRETSESSRCQQPLPRDHPRIIRVGSTTRTEGTSQETAGTAGTRSSTDWAGNCPSGWELPWWGWGCACPFPPMSSTSWKSGGQDRKRRISRWGGGPSWPGCHPNKADVTGAAPWPRSEHHCSHGKDPRSGSYPGQESRESHLGEGLWVCIGKSKHPASVWDGLGWK